MMVTVFVAELKRNASESHGEREGTRGNFRSVSENDYCVAAARR